MTHEWLSRFSSRTIAVVGDVMLDEFVVGHVDRISPEAPVPVVRFARHEYRLGGAANVAHNVRSLGGRARLVGLVGGDPTAEALQRALVAHGLSDAHLIVDPSRPTTRKTRVVTTRHQQVARIDYESDDVPSAEALAALSAATTEAVRAADATILSDYRKGVVTPAIIAAAVSAARARQGPLLIDPKVADAARYRGATLLTPNHHEAEIMTGIAVRTAADARSAARAIHEKCGASVLITWGEHGMWIFDAASSPAVDMLIPAAAREVADVTGAGDTVIATLALSLASGATLTEAATLATLAAGIVVGRFGPSAVTVDDLR